MPSSKEYQARWRAKNKEKIKAYSLSYRERLGKEKANEQSRARTAAWRKRNPKQFKAAQRKYSTRYRLKKKFGITVEQRDAMLAGQGGVCKGCGSSTPNWKGDWHVDHCHKTGQIRGILCHNCNTALGRVKDDPDILQALIKYLESNAESKKTPLKRKPKKDA
jgi:hypothetical protein